MIMCGCQSSIANYGKVYYTTQDIYNDKVYYAAHGIHNGQVYYTTHHIHDNQVHYTTYIQNDQGGVSKTLVSS